MIRRRLVAQSFLGVSAQSFLRTPTPAMFRLQSTTTSTPVVMEPAPTASACPFSGTATATPTATACPIMGGAPMPNLACPIETEEIQDMPFKTIVSQMGKVRLSGFVTATAVVAYVIAGGANPIVASALTVGTMLQSMSANTANQIIEVEHDKKMKRTCRRPLPIGAITKSGALALSMGELAIGTATLAAVSPYAAGLGLLNWWVYVGMYTPLKRVSAINTWFGSIVGGIPPLMGGVALTGSLTAAAMGPANLLGAFLLVWQIPHFMALSFHCRRDYETAGYKMLAFANPWRASFYTVFMSFVMAGITLAGPSMVGLDVEAMWYYPVTFAANALMIYKSYRFHMDPVKFCRSCFVFSYMYLGVMLVVYLVNHAKPVCTIVGAYNYALGIDE